MRVLHLGPDIASQMTLTVEALRRAGAEAVGWRLPPSTVEPEAPSASVETFEAVRRDAPWHRFRILRERAAILEREIERADIVHWHFGATAHPRGVDLQIARRTGTAGVVEFWGSDIRIDEIAAVENPPYRDRGPDYEYARMETRRASFARQSRFRRAGISACLLPPGFDRYLEPEAFPLRRSALPRVDRSRLAPSSGSASDRFVIVHAPSAEVAKGTAWVRTAVDTLNADGAGIELKVLHGAPHEQVLDAMSSADLVLDQFVVGDAYGLVAVEGMGTGVPVVAWLTDAARRVLPDDLPIVCSDGPSLTEQLRELLADRDRRASLGQQGVSFVQAHHDADAFARRLLSDVYPEVMRHGR